MVAGIIPLTRRLFAIAILQLMQFNTVLSAPQIAPLPTKFQGCWVVSSAVDKNTSIPDLIGTLVFVTQNEIFILRPTATNRVVLMDLVEIAPHADIEQTEVRALIANHEDNLLTQNTGLQCRLRHSLVNHDFELAITVADKGNALPEFTGTNSQLVCTQIVGKEAVRRLIREVSGLSLSKRILGRVVDIRRRFGAQTDEVSIECDDDQAKFKNVVTEPPPSDSEK